jgi:hypothetical protein
MPAIMTIGTKFISLEARWPNAPLIFEIAMPAPRSSEEGSFLFHFNDEFWKGQRILSLAYFDQTCALTK